MAKQPKLVLRESCIEDVSSKWPAGSFVEMGAGTGHMSRLFLARGFHGACHDLGEGSRRIMRANFANVSKQMRVVDELNELKPASFDYLFAFEVLEHIEEDAAVLAEWTRYLRPGGRILMSVPAHAAKFGRSDEIAGHCRRYERKGLQELLECAGYDQIRMVNYGFPITELTRIISNWMIRNDRSYDTVNQLERSVQSARARPEKIDRLLSVSGSRFVLPFCFIQRWFYAWDLGDGLVANAVKLDR